MFNLFKKKKYNRAEVKVIDIYFVEVQTGNFPSPIERFNFSLIEFGSGQRAIIDQVYGKIGDTFLSDLQEFNFVNYRFKILSKESDSLNEKESK